ncbi:DNA repair exonuclease SbcCD nuclease subunit [Paenibacillus catalpae]|uniref:DNA repair exonuclease SbcCD nuclease subunit n=1 Tax=Paenibacillus catalpae TaxID=1045775 RepID=A0A1I1TLD5_9BACL|nr:DNA repair exonuclease [Paenibacillus catalpae]SFD56230.1 DNA repair exonuclease SbcCD nuclease subunit [Paenibacillus catalpae]
MAVPFRFIHAADLHLDSPFRGMSKVPERLKEKLMASTFSALRRLTETAIQEQVDFIVISGDLYDEADRSLKAQLQLLKEWERLQQHGIAVFVIHGNHDPLNGARAELKLPPNVTQFGANQMEYRPAYCRNGELAAFVYGMSYGKRHVTDNLAATYMPAEGAPFHIAMLHGNVNGDQSHDPYAPCSLEELVGKGFDYWALGHIHTRRVLHEYPHVVYSGNIQGRNPRETGPKGCYLVEVSALQAVQLNFVPLDEIRWLEAGLSITGLTTEQELLQRLEELVEQLALEGEGRTVMLRLLLQGQGPLHQKLAETATIRALLEQLQQLSVEAWVYALEGNTKAELRLSELEAEDSFSGELFRLTQRLEADQQAWRREAAAAVAPLADHAKLGRLLRGQWDELPRHWLEQARELAIGLLMADGSEGRKDE